jgi:hypothetical protein
MVDPTGKLSSEVRAAVETRTADMKKELKEYLARARQRADV